LDQQGQCKCFGLFLGMQVCIHSFIHSSNGPSLSMITG
jgi:hypothetical protein